MPAIHDGESASRHLSPPTLRLSPPHASGLLPPHNPRPGVIAVSAFVGGTGGLRVVPGAGRRRRALVLRAQRGIGSSLPGSHQRQIRVHLLSGQRIVRRCHAASWQHFCPVRSEAFYTAVRDCAALRSGQMGTDQDETGYQRQFNAAVSVIQNLPKNGAYRPSYEEMLRFYGYYKQATVGPCNISRPGFWDPIGKYKWDAWSKLGAMSQDDAMCAYIREMKMVAQKIIDTFPLEAASPEMFEPFRPLYDVIPDMPRPPDSFFTTSSEAEHPEDTTEHAIPQRGEEMGDRPSRDVNQYATIMEEVELGAEELEQRTDPLGEAKHPVQADQRLPSWGSENDYSDSVEQLMSDQECEHGSKMYPHLSKASDDTHKKSKTRSRRKSADRRREEDNAPVPHSTHDAWLRNLNEEDQGDSSSGLQTRCQNNPHHLSPQIKATVEALQASIQGLCQRLESLERTLQDQRQNIESQAQISHKVPKQQLPLPAKSQTFLFIVIWPFVVHWLLRRFLWRKR